MLNMHNINDKEKMMNYYRTSDMLNLIFFFPNLSPITDLIIIEDEEDYLKNKDLIETYTQNRVDTIKGKPLISVENSGGKNDFYNTLLKVKEKDPNGVLVLFKVSTTPSERYERYAGISVGVDLYQDVIIDAVSQGFDGREVSKSISTHERYIIPWYDLRKISIENFKNYQTYQITNEEYQKSRQERINFLESVNLKKEIFEKHIPKNYKPIPDFIWQSLIRNLLKELEKNEDILEAYNLTNFAISGHTEQKEFKPWQIFDKSRYTLVGKQKN